ncbi:MAG: alpha/beta fold hydrolase [Methyloceanibacter sp.]|uniref:alpha/beta fold hydrolase n=1 Tax=Methyloceanibacter sp. TaxID=1965321 RepID=UPI003D9B68E3
MPALADELWRDIHYASFDDLRLYARHYPARGATARSVVCLPGLTRNSKDFHTLAWYLSTHPERPRDVYCLDFRGRGASQFDRHWHNYTPLIELRDTLDFMAIVGLHQAAIVGTSRGGIVAMMMGALRPTAMGVVVLNDIGPVMETRGLARIMGYVGKMPVPRTWDDAVVQLREMNGRAFSAIAAAQWEEIAHDLFNERKGRPARGYDPKIGRAFRGVDLRRPAPALWPQFTALQQFPAFVLRGANSDLLSAETVSAMVERHPNLRTVTVPGQGHAPFLRDRDSVEAIEMFLAAND